MWVYGTPFCGSTFFLSFTPVLGFPFLFSEVLIHGWSLFQFSHVKSLEILDFQVVCQNTGFGCGMLQLSVYYFFL